MRNYGLYRKVLSRKVLRIATSALNFFATYVVDKRVLSSDKSMQLRKSLELPREPSRISLRGNLSIINRYFRVPLGRVNES